MTIPGQLRPDDVQDALPRIVQTEGRDPGALGVLHQRVGHGALLRIGDRGKAAAVGGNVMIGRGKGPMRGARSDAALAQHLEGWSRTVLDQVATDVEQHLPVRTFHDPVPGPDLLEQCLRCVHCVAMPFRSGSAPCLRGRG
jgi:hypothetical protein